MLYSETSLHPVWIKDVSYCLVFILILLFLVRSFHFNDMMYTYLLLHFPVDGFSQGFCGICELFCCCCFCFMCVCVCVLRACGRTGGCMGEWVYAWNVGFRQLSLVCDLRLSCWTPECVCYITLILLECVLLLTLGHLVCDSRLSCWSFSCLWVKTVSLKVFFVTPDCLVHVVSVSCSWLKTCWSACILFLTEYCLIRVCLVCHSKTVLCWSVFCLWLWFSSVPSCWSV